MPLDGVDTETGKARPRQLGTYPSRRAAEAAARVATVERRTPGERGTVGWLVKRWVASRTDVSLKAREQTRGPAVTSKPASVRCGSSGSIVTTSPSG